MPIFDTVEKMEKFYGGAHNQNLQIAKYEK